MGSFDVFGLLVSLGLIGVGAFIVVSSRAGSTFERARGNGTPQMRFLGLGQLALGVAQLGENLEGAVIPRPWHGWTEPAWITLNLAAVALLVVAGYHLRKDRSR